ncbi:TadE/TadG family type IV pilus assembly protein [uncultured Tessaracoccus sp.]|uniref:TadE/TadG family type IV pilus assembly protein n=1 Tax=uncultured Tessaracoccus sp. TaxID=905023 RepID=UPI0025F0907F|nr:TadE/TadG family type IV pilus assembly protein [uncultured Tessaracoccus sp.]
MHDDERGLSGSVQVTLLLPLVFGLFLLALHWAMLTWAETTALAAAQDAARVAALPDVPDADGEQAALQAADNGSLQSPSVHVHRTPDEVRAVVRGRALGVVPFLPTDVEARASARLG